MWRAMHGGDDGRALLEHMGLGGGAAAGEGGSSGVGRRWGRHGRAAGSRRRSTRR